VIFFLYCYHPPLYLLSFPTRRSSDLASTSAAKCSCISTTRTLLCCTAQTSERQWNRQAGRFQPMERRSCCERHGQGGNDRAIDRSEEHTSELQSRGHLVCRLLLEKKN